MGAYQLHHTAVADYAAISECVEACRGLGKPWAKGLVNGVLRALQREETIEPNSESLAERDHPEWLRILLHRQYGKAALELMEANNRRAPMTLRINQVATHPEAFKRRLQEANIPFADGPWEESVTLLEPQVAADLPGWTLGECAVQDQAAQHAAHLVMSALRHRSPNPSPVKVLDACAAGGKLFITRSIDPRAHCSLPVCSRQQTNATARTQHDRIAVGSCHSRPCRGFNTANRIYQPDLRGRLCNRPAFPEPFDIILIGCPMFRQRPSDATQISVCCLPKNCS